MKSNRNSIVNSESFNHCLQVIHMRKYAVVEAFLRGRRSWKFCFQTEPIWGKPCPVSVSTLTLGQLHMAMDTSQHVDYLPSGN